MDNLQPCPWKFTGSSNPVASFCHFPMSVSPSSAFSWYFFNLCYQGSFDPQKIASLFFPLLPAIFSPGDEIDMCTLLLLLLIPRFVS